MGDFYFRRWLYILRSKILSSIYLPFVYTHLSKRGNKNHLINVVFLEDFSILLLASVVVGRGELALLIPLLLLTFSFWCIYEVGYYENDLYELLYETKHSNPTKIAYISKVKNQPFEIYAWGCALTLGFFASWFLDGNYCLEIACQSSVFQKFLLWTGWLVIVRLIYRAYNYSSFSIRQILFLLLQTSRLAGPLLFLPINFWGGSLIASQIISRWVGYLVYRAGGDRAKVQTQKRIVRHCVFILLMICVALVKQDWSLLLCWQVAVIVVWSITRAHFRSITKFLKSTSA